MRGNEAFFLAGRILFGGFFVVGSGNHFTNLAGLSSAAAAQGVPLPTFSVLLTGILLLVGGLSVMIGLYPHIGAAFLMAFLVGVTPVMHAFWAIADPAQSQLQLAFFLRNIAFLGAALILWAIPTPWSLSVAPRVPVKSSSRRGAY